MEDAGHLRAQLLALTLLAGACGDCPAAFEISAHADVAPGERIELIVPDGEVEVLGRERSAALRVDARGCRASGDTRVEQTAGDGVRTLRVVAPRADVRVQVPAGAAIDVNHGSGHIDARALGPLSLTTRGGDVRIAQVVGGVRVRAGPGTLYVREVVGDLDVTDGPGAMFVEGVMGGVRIRDGSGGIHVREIEGDVTVEADGGGAIDARTVGGALEVRAKTLDARMIRWNDVAGGVRLPARD